MRHKVQALAGACRAICAVPACHILSVGATKSEFKQLCTASYVRAHQYNEFTFLLSIVQCLAFKVDSMLESSTVLPGNALWKLVRPQVSLSLLEKQCS